MEEEYVKLVMLRNKPLVRETFKNTVSELDYSKLRSPPQRWSFSQRYLYELGVVNRVEKINLAPSCGWWHPSICFAVLKLTLLNRWNYSKQYDILLSCVSNKGRFHEKVAVLFYFVQITSPSPQFGQLVQLFFNAKNVDLSDIQNDAMSKILHK